MDHKLDTRFKKYDNSMQLMSKSHPTTCCHCPSQLFACKSKIWWPFSPHEAMKLGRKATGAIKISRATSNIVTKSNISQIFKTILKFWFSSFWLWTKQSLNSWSMRDQFQHLFMQPPPKLQGPHHRPYYRAQHSSLLPLLQSYPSEAAVIDPKDVRYCIVEHDILW